MTRTEALEAVRRLSLGLAPDLGGTLRLLERVSQHDEAEALRAYLAERGAVAVLEETET